MSKWPVKTLGEIGQIVAGGTPSTNEPAFWNGKIPWITPADLSGYREKYIGHGEKFISEKGLAESSAKLMPAGAVLFSSRAPIGYVAIAQNPVCTNQGFKSVVPNKEVVDSEYLYHYLKFAKHLADDLASGTTFKEISGKNFAKISVPVPSITEQRQVVSKINELFSNIDAGASELKQSAANLDLYKQSVLNAAIHGKLVPQDPNDEPAFKLLQRIRSEKEKLIQAGKLRKEKPMPPIDPSEVPFELPKGWAWVPLAAIADSRLGKMLDKQKNKGMAYPYLRNTHVHWFDINCADLKDILLEEKEVDDLLLRDGDVLICEGGHGIARTAVWRGEVTPMVFQKALHRVRPTFALDPDFFSFCMYVFFQAGILQYYFTGAGIPHFTGESLARMYFPLPPIEEQLRIVRRVDEVLSLTKYASEIDRMLNSSDHLKQSILKVAFEGSLI